MDSAVYQLNGVVKRYGLREVCHIDQLELRRGSITGVIGPSGAGKSTLLRLLGFIEPPTSGLIRFMGLEANGAATLPPEVKRKVVMVFQRPLLMNTTVWGNVVYGLRLRGMKDYQERAEVILNRLGLTELIKAQVNTLSGGEVQRVALARAMVIEPGVVLLDEPTANLDPYNVALIEEMIKEVNCKKGTTVVIVTHNVFQARRLAQRTAFILDGRLIEEGITEQLFTSPRNKSTDDFINGRMIY